MVEGGAKYNPVVEWGIQQGMHVTGMSSPYEFLQMIRQFQTADVSAPVQQDALLSAGSEDHYVPVEQFYQQIEMLSYARSITARLSARSECAQNYCQVGNIGLTLNIIVNWLDGMQKPSA